jgi:TIR domain
MSKKIFISYRHDDTRRAAKALCKALRTYLPRENVFIDDEIPSGVDFTDYIMKSIDQADHVFILIGDKWANRRLYDPADLLKAEVRRALDRHVAVPILVDGARLPAESALPSDIKDLLGRQGYSIHERSEDFDINIIAEAHGILPIAEQLRPGSTPLRAPRSTRLATGVAAAVIATIAYIWHSYPKLDVPEHSTITETKRRLANVEAKVAREEAARRDADLRLKEIEAKAEADRLKRQVEAKPSVTQPLGTKSEGEVRVTPQPETRTSDPPIRSSGAESPSPPKASPSLPIVLASPAPPPERIPLRPARTFSIVTTAPTISQEFIDVRAALRPALERPNMTWQPSSPDLELHVDIKTTVVREKIGEQIASVTVTVRCRAAAGIAPCPQTEWSQPGKGADFSANDSLDRAIKAALPNLTSRITSAFNLSRP